MKRKIPLEFITGISLSDLQDDFLVVHVKDDYDTLVEAVFKTEFLSTLNKKLTEKFSTPLNVSFGRS